MFLLWEFTFYPVFEINNRGSQPVDLIDLQQPWEKIIDSKVDGVTARVHFGFFESNEKYKEWHNGNSFIGDIFKESLEAAIDNTVPPVRVEANQSQDIVLGATVSASIENKTAQELV